LERIEKEMMDDIHDAWLHEGRGAFEEYDEPLFDDKSELKEGDLIILNNALHFWNGNKWEQVETPDGKPLLAKGSGEEAFADSLAAIFSGQLDNFFLSLMRKDTENYSRKDLLAALLEADIENVELLIERDLILKELELYQDMGSLEDIEKRLYYLETCEDSLAVLFHKDGTCRARERGWKIVLVDPTALSQILESDKFVITEDSGQCYIYLRSKND
jgi:hypothetical protein